MSTPPPDPPPSLYFGKAAPSSTSLSLLNLARGFDPKAWQRLTDLYRPLIVKWCGRAGVTGADAEDVAQEVFLAVAERLAEFERIAPGSFRGWLRGITRNKLGRHFRDRQRRPAAAGGDDNPLDRLADWPADETAEALRRESRDLAQRAAELVRGEFPDPVWRAFWQVVVEGRSPADVAADLGITRNSVYIARCRVLRRLRDEFGEVFEVPAE